MFMGAPKNKMLRKMSVDTYMYLPIFYRTKLECRSSLRIRRNILCIVQKKPQYRDLDKIISL